MPKPNPLLEEIIAAFKDRGGVASPSEIHETIHSRGRINLSAYWARAKRDDEGKARVRAEIERYSSDSKNYGGKRDLFRHVRYGVWALRQDKEGASEPPTEETPTDVANQPPAQETDELEKARAKKDEEGAFSPSDLNDARKRILEAIVLRQGQREFRERLLAAYQRSCAVTGCDVVEALEAAHTVPYLGPETNHVKNGLLLRADIHTLFDLGLIAVNPSDYRVLVSRSLEGSCYESFAGQVIRLPADRADYPSRQALEMRLVEFQPKEIGRHSA